MIPPEELARLRDVYDIALLLRAEGRPLEGYHQLDFALMWAETPPLNLVTGETEPLELWEPALADLYRRALMDYAALLGSGGTYCR